MKIGLIADIHGDLVGFQAALRVFERQGVDRILCAGDIVDRGPDADTIVQLLQERSIACIKGNHDYTVVSFQAHWRTADNPQRLAQLGRIVSDETVNFLVSLPDTTRFTFEGVRLLMAHGTPWSDVMAAFPGTRQSIFDRIVERYAGDTEVVILGHTHVPMCVQIGGMWVLNPGSIYGVTVRDSHTCAVLILPGCDFRVFDLESGKRIEIPVVQR